MVDKIQYVYYPADIFKGEFIRPVMLDSVHKSGVEILVLFKKGMMPNKKKRSPTKIIKHQHGMQGKALTKVYLLYDLHDPMVPLGFLCD